MSLLIISILFDSLAGAATSPRELSTSNKNLGTIGLSAPEESICLRDAQHAAHGISS